MAIKDIYKIYKFFLFISAHAPLGSSEVNLRILYLNKPENKYTFYANRLKKINETTNLLWKLYRKSHG